MSFVIAALVCSQLVLPATRTGLEFGDRQPQQYPASGGDIAWKPDGGLGAIWLDGRRSLGEATVGTRLDLWGSKLAVGAATPIDPTGVLLVAAPPAGVLESPAIAFNSGAAAIVWLERRPATTVVHLALGNEDDASILAAPRVLTSGPGITGVAVTAAGTGFIVAWSSGTQLTWTRVETAGAAAVPVVTQVAGTQTVSQVLVTGFSDGGAVFAYATGPTPRSGLFTHDYSSPTADAGLLFDTSGALAGMGLHGPAPSLLTRNPTGDLQNRTSSLASTAVTSTRAQSECVVAGNEALTALAYVDTANASQVGFISSSGALRVIAAPTAEAVAVAANSTHGAYLHRVTGLSVVTRAAASNSFEPPTELNVAQPTQRGPSVAWLPNASGFVIAWEERGTQTMGVSQTWTGRLALVRPDGGTTELFNTGLPQALPVSPRVVEWDNDTVGVEDQGTTSRTHRLFRANGSITAADVLSGTGWRSSAGPPLLRWREGTPTQTIIDQVGALTLTTPRCATTVNGKHLLGGWSGSGLVVYEILLAVTSPGTIAARTTLPLRGSLCITRGRSTSDALVTWSEGDAVRVQPWGTTSSPSITIPGATGSISFENPVATRLGSGVLVVWETPPAYSSIGAAFVDDANPTVPVMVALRTGSDLVRNPTVTSAPGGPAIVAWQEFDGTAGVGATRVRARMVFPPVRPDAGVDAGAPDAGAIDAGVGVIDAGVSDGGDVDGGVMDAGSVDGGEADAGQPPAPDAGEAMPVAELLTFTPSCGCSGGPGGLALVLLALWARRRSRRAR